MQWCRCARKRNGQEQSKCAHLHTIIFSTKKMWCCVAKNARILKDKTSPFLKKRQPPKTFANALLPKKMLRGSSPSPFLLEMASMDKHRPYQLLKFSRHGPASWATRCDLPLTRMQLYGAIFCISCISCILSSRLNATGAVLSAFRHVWIGKVGKGRFNTLNHPFCMHDFMHAGAAVDTCRIASYQRFVCFV